jgi:hypothetical protein
MSTAHRSGPKDTSTLFTGERNPDNILGVAIWKDVHVGKVVVKRDIVVRRYSNREERVFGYLDGLVTNDTIIIDAEAVITDHEECIGPLVDAV